MLGVDYHQYELPPALRDDPSRGVIASYAWGDDYHEDHPPAALRTGRLDPHPHRPHQPG
ncbi:MAG: DUF1730 domain-containing protein [Anaerolineales bacterium]|nr:DUF1730 domain-containing protein [Anaerolineales bacterium]